VEGSFALVFRDRERSHAVAARDGMGNRSAGYVLTAERFLVGPDDAALAAAGSDTELDRLRLAELFAGEELSGPGTFFAHVRALVPGELLLVGADEVRRRPLPRPEPASRLEAGTRPEELVERFAALLDAAVARRLRGCRRAAVMLSGGLDSAPLALLAARHLGGDAVTALSWRLDAAAADERRFVEATARAGGLDVEWIAGDDPQALPFAGLDRWPVNPSSPEDTAYRWLHERSYRRARELGHDLVLWGFGGDSLYAPARRWWWTLLAAEGIGPAVDQLRAVAAESGWPAALRRHVLAPLLPKARELRRRPPPWLEPAAVELLREQPRWPRDVERARRPGQADRLLALLDAEGCHFERWHARRCGVELAFPLRDAALVELCLAVDDHLLQRGDESRVLLREASRGLLPEEVRTRRGKASLRDLVDRGLAPARLRPARSLLLADEALWRGFVSAAAVERWLDADFRDDGERAALLRCLHAEVWRRRRAGESLTAVDLDATAPR
jgi:asparagine synthase (glutamine-hydrolysing)